MPYPYATLTAVKARLGITDTTDDAMLASLVERGNAKVELYTGRAIGSNTATLTFDGYDALENMRCLLVKDGVRAVNSILIAPYTGGPQVSIPTTEVFIRPTLQERQPGWPGTELWFTDVPQASDTYPYWPPGYQNITLGLDLGWTAMPEEVREQAETAIVRAFQRRQVGEGDTTGAPDLGETIVFNRWEKAVLDVYKWRPVYVL